MMGKLTFYKAKKGTSCDNHWSAKADVKVVVIRNGKDSEKHLCKKCFSEVTKNLK